MVAYNVLNVVKEAGLQLKVSDLASSIRDLQTQSTEKVKLSCSVDV